MFGLTPLGPLHTIISLVAVCAGLQALVRKQHISSANKVYLICTVLSCLTGFGIFAHGGFTKAHGLGALTLIVLALAYGAGRRGWFGAAAPYVETVGYSATFFFHMIPGITETSTRLPLGAPLLPNAEAPELQAATGVLFLLFLIGATWQVLRLRRARRAGKTAFV